MNRRSASCACGKLQISCEGDPLRISMCHCDDCQRRTGSLFSIAAFFPRDCVAVLRGSAKTFVRDSLSGKPVAFHFCPDCGSTLFWEASRMPDRIGVAVGAFADPSFPRPEQSVWSKDKHLWLDLPGDLPIYDLMPPPRKAE